MKLSELETEKILRAIDIAEKRQMIRYLKFCCFFVIMIIAFIDGVWFLGFLDELNKIEATIINIGAGLAAFGILKGKR